MRLLLFAGSLLLAGCGSSLGSRSFNPEDADATIQWAIQKQAEMGRAKASGNDATVQQATAKLAAERDAYKGRRLSWLMPVAKITADGKCEVSPLDYSYQEQGRQRTIRLRVSSWGETGPLILTPAPADVEWAKTLSRGDRVRVTGVIAEVQGAGGWRDEGPPDHDQLAAWGVAVKDIAVTRP